MSFGSTAYAAFIRIHRESGERTPKPWTELPHVRRLAWEAAAQEVARAIIPESFSQDPSDVLEELHDDGLLVA